MQQKLIKRIGISVMFLGAFISGFCSMQQNDNPYKVSYQRAVVHVPVIYAKDLADETLAIGEKHLGSILAQALTQAGIETHIYSYEDMHGNKNFRQGFDIYLRTWMEFELPQYHSFFDEDKIGVLMETVPYELRFIEKADVVFTGSEKKNKSYRQQGINSYFLPQFTDFSRFYPDPKDELRYSVLYVANQWWDFPTRKAVAYAKETGIRLDVFGVNWDQELSGEYADWLKGKHIPNNELRHYYSSADIVLNDTREDMIEAGFISNRIYDATACKAFVISDYIPELEEIYGDAIPMYKNAEEFKALIEYYLAHPDERREKAEKAYRITRENFGVDKVIYNMAQVLKAEAQKKAEGK